MAIVKTDAQNYADIAAAIRSKSGGTGQYKPREMPGAILGLASGSVLSSILVYAPTGSEITLTCGDVVRTVAENNGLWRFDSCELGSWTVAAALNGMTNIQTVEIQEQGQMMRYEVHIVYLRTYGISRNITNASPVWTRTDDAVGMDAAPSVGTVAGHSDFDNCYPWSGITRETLSTGDVMVRIPKFWYKRYRNGNMEYIQVCNGEKSGFKLHPAFCHSGTEQDAVYVAAYKTNNSAKSVSGTSPRVSETMDVCRTKAKAKGDGWSLLDISTLSALQMLFLVEYASYNSQLVFAPGYSKGTSSDSAKTSGTTDSVPNLTGVPVGTVGMVDMVWRGIEGLWGNVYQYIDGIAGKDGYFYVCNDPSKYVNTASSDYTKVDFEMPARGTTNKYITELCCQEGDMDYLMLPQKIESGSSTTFVCDSIASVSSGDCIMRHGGRWYSNEYVGLFMYDMTTTVASSYKYNGNRLMYIP